MSESIFDANRLLLMINYLNVSSGYLKNTASESKIDDIELKWNALLSTMHSCFTYAQTNNVDLREYKEDLKQIVENLYYVEQEINDKKYTRLLIVDELAQGMIFISKKIDNIFTMIGWKRVMQPITEAIFLIPQKIHAMFSGKKVPSKRVIDAITHYLPPPKNTFPIDNEQNQYQPKKNESKIDECEWEEVENKKTDSFARLLLNEMQDRISRNESGEE
jgi:hypothetical protein